MTPVGAQDPIPLGPVPVLLGADKVGHIAPEHASGWLLVHAGGESPTDVRILRPGDPSSEASVVRSGPSWQRVAYPEPPANGEVRVEGDGAVWIAAMTGPVHRSERLTVGCGGLGEPLLWLVAAEAVLIRREGPQAPAIVLHVPRPAPPAPDEPAVVEHTVILGPGDGPLFLSAVALRDGCEGTTVLEVARGVDSGLLDPGWRLLIGFLAGLVALGAVAGFGMWLMARDREDHRRYFR